MEIFGDSVHTWVSLEGGMQRFPARPGQRGASGELIFGRRAPVFVYCASISPSVRCVSAIVRPTAASVSNNLRRKPALYCASLHLWGSSPICAHVPVWDSDEAFPLITDGKRDAVDARTRHPGLGSYEPEQDLGGER
jgi:hypothetical protein